MYALDMEHVHHKILAFVLLDILEEIVQHVYALLDIVVVTVINIHVLASLQQIPQFVPVMDNVNLLTLVHVVQDSVELNVKHKLKQVLLALARHQLILQFVQDMVHV